MLSTFIIALREGLEAALIVGILVAYVVKTGRSNLLKPIWSGVLLALALSFGLGAFLSYSSTQLSERGEEIFAGTSSVIAVALVTWTVFWMKRAARGLRDELHGKVDKAHLGGPLTIAVQPSLQLLAKVLKLLSLSIPTFVQSGQHLLPQSASFLV